jgi:hypothetical protein
MDTCRNQKILDCRIARQIQRGLRRSWNPRMEVKIAGWQAVAEVSGPNTAEEEEYLSKCKEIYSC